MTGITVDTRDFYKAMPASEDDRRRIERGYLRFVTAGVEFGVTIAALALLGVWLDGRFHTSPVLTTVLTLIGFAAATWNLLRTVLRDEPRPHGPENHR